MRSTGHPSRVPDGRGIDEAVDGSDHGGWSETDPEDLPVRDPLSLLPGKLGLALGGPPLYDSLLALRWALVSSLDLDHRARGSGIVIATVQGQM